MPRPVADPSYFPPLPLDAWEQTKHTLHLYLQIIGKVRLACMPKQNHWWHVPLYVTSRGLTTGTMPVPGALHDRVFEIAVDFIDHAVRISDSEGDYRRIDLEDGLTVRDFYLQTIGALDGLEIGTSIRPEPFDHPNSTLAFFEDEEHHRYYAEAAQRFWRILSQVEPIFQTFRGRFLGKASPVHLFWHSLDLAYTRFSGRPAPPLSGADAVTQEAYSHEVISFGFWAGDDTIREPAFYAYAAPEPDALTDAPLHPDAAYWQTQESGSLAILPYDAVRVEDAPDEEVLTFLETTYQACADRAEWDAEAFRAPGAPATTKPVE